MQAQTVNISVSNLYVDETAGYRGFALRETAGASAVVRVRAGGVSGLILDTVSLAANQSSSDYYDEGLEASGGIYVQVVSGTVEGSVRFR